jgi:hypothetical protein
MTKFVATYDGNRGERKARVQGAWWGDGECARGPGYGRGRGEATTIVRGDRSGAGGASPGGLKWLASWLGWTRRGWVGWGFRLLLEALGSQYIYSIYMCVCVERERDCVCVRLMGAQGFQ